MAKGKVQSFIVTIFSLFSLIGQTAELTPPQQNWLNSGIKSYIYAYPLVLMEVSKKVSTATATPASKGSRIMAPINQFATMRAFPTPEFKDVVRPNADTLYSSAWLNLSKEPIVLSVPNTNGRYYIMELLDAWSNVFGSIGKRTTGTTAKSFAIVGPYWQGTLPDNLIKIPAPTNTIWIIGRTQTHGSKDYPVVHDIQNGYKLTPLSFWGKTYTPQPVPVDSSIDTMTPPVMQVANMDALTFFNIFADALKNNPPDPADKDMLNELKNIGIEPGKSFDPESLTAEQKEMLNQAVKTAQEQIKQHAENQKRINGWFIPSIVGKYGTHYLDRASVALWGLGANLPEDAIYPTAFYDAKDQPLNGKYHYKIHFDKDNLPPAKAFWSLTMYNPESFFVANPINRYAIGDRDILKLNTDGSLDIYIQHESPGKDFESNWLPSPEGLFNLTLRIYWPEQAVINGLWLTPGIQKTN